VDIPPFGFSERLSTPAYGNADQAKRIVALMDALGIKHAILFGHSFGGGATIETALTIPNRVDMLILEDVGGLNLNLQPASNDGPTTLDLFLRAPALRNPVLAATATNPLFARILISTIVHDPNSITANEIKILQAPAAS
jgi:pimeloyl-ACP methyl ester carboxylesterase